MERVSVMQPLKIFQKLTGKSIIVKLKNNKALRGILTSYDGCMNLVLDEAEEIDPKTDQPLVKYGRVFIRGNQVLYISTLNTI